MGLNRFTLRRELTPSTWKHDPQLQVRFGEIKINEYFFLTPPNTTRLAFVKVNSWGAQVDNPDNDSGYPDQAFSADTMVYRMVRAGADSYVPRDRSTGHIR